MKTMSGEWTEPEGGPVEIIQYRDLRLILDLLFSASSLHSVTYEALWYLFPKKSLSSARPLSDLLPIFRSWLAGFPSF